MTGLLAINYTELHHFITATSGRLSCVISPVPLHPPLRHGRDEPVSLSSSRRQRFQLRSRRADQSPGRIWRHARLRGSSAGGESRAQQGATAAAGPGPRRVSPRPAQKRVPGGSVVQRNHQEGRAGHRRGHLPGADLSGLQR